MAGSSGRIAASDGVTWNAIYSTRDLLRELPARWLAGGGPLPPREILEIALSSYASRSDRRPTPHRRRRAAELQRSWLGLVDAVARARRGSREAVLRDLARRAAVIDRRDRITGDAVDYATAEILRQPRLRPEQVHRLISGFAASQDLTPGAADPAAPPPGAHTDLRRVFDAMLSVVDELRHGL
jgi:hypothetical protein